MGTLKKYQIDQLYESDHCYHRVCAPGCQTKKIPFEIALNVDSETNGITLKEAMLASERIWQSSIQNGTDKMTPEAIEAEIAAVRVEKKARKADI